MKCVTADSHVKIEIYLIKWASTINTEENRQRMGRIDYFFLENLMRIASARNLLDWISPLL